MDSEPIGGGGDGVHQKQRFTEYKVYFRKVFKGSRKNPPTNTSTEINVVPPSQDAVAPAPAPVEHASPSPAEPACPAPNPNVLAIPGPDDPPSDPSNKVFTTTDASKNVEGDNNITPTSLNSNVNDDHNLNKGLQAVTEDVNLTSLQPVIMLCTVCDDSSTLSQQQDAVEVTGTRPQDLPSGNCPISTIIENQIKVNSTSRSKQDTQELRQKLETELGIVRSWVKRIEEKQGQLSGYGPSNASKEGVDDNDGIAKIARSEVVSVGTPREVSRPFHRLRLSVLDNSHRLGDSIEKEKRTPKANQFYRNSEFLLANDKFPPVESNKKSKSNGKKLSGESGLGFLMGSKFFKSCGSLLEKLMKHKHGWVFNTPVDVKGLGLLDYFLIIKHPMDLGTVKLRLSKNWYKSPKEFAEDVRLTFRNAMTYNPNGQDVHVMAKELSQIFEERWVIIESDYNREMRHGLDYGVALSMPTSRKAHPPRPPPLDMRRILDRSELMSHPVDYMLKAITLTPSSRTPAPKKPKAKDPDKRDMTYEEKQKLSTKLQSLPLERLDAVVQIIKKRNSELFQNDEEIEVDIDNVDAETLWELDRFVTNYKKSLSKKKRKAEIAILASQARANSEHEVKGKTLAPAMSDATKENKADENVVSSVSAFQGEKEGDNRSRSSSSSSSSSDSETSSSDSDSESSSASGSDMGSPRT